MSALESQPNTHPLLKLGARFVLFVLNSKLYKWILILLIPDVSCCFVKDQGTPVVVGALKPERTFFETVGICKNWYASLQAWRPESSTGVPFSHIYNFTLCESSSDVCRHVSSSDVCRHMSSSVWCCFAQYRFRFLLSVAAIYYCFIWFRNVLLFLELHNSLLCSQNIASPVMSLNPSLSAPEAYREHFRRTEHFGIQWL